MIKYHFVTEWDLRAPAERVWALVKEPESMAEWWPEIKQVKLRGENKDFVKGNIIDVVIKGFLKIGWEITVPYLTTDILDGDFAECPQSYFSFHRIFRCQDPKKHIKRFFLQWVMSFFLFYHNDPALGILAGKTSVTEVSRRWHRNLYF